MPKILIIDDEQNTREGLKKALLGTFEVRSTEDGKKAILLLEESHFDVVLTDLRMPGIDGLELIRRITRREDPPICIMLTAYGSVENAVEAMKAGAYDYLSKPINLDKLDFILQRALESQKLQKENRDLKRELASKYAFENMIGKSDSMQKVFDTLKQVACARSTVLLTGESGTGKELAARALHQLSDRAEKPFIAVHCGALSRNLLESELFGHEKGAFTGATQQRIGRFESADGGTIFLDEIGEIEPSVQVLLLRVLESRTFERVGGSKLVEVNVRLIAATNQHLKQMVDQGLFREDLYYRFKVINIHMPALAERKQDIPLLLKYFLDIFNQENHRDIQGFSADALAILMKYTWPGNIREIRNAVEHMVVMSTKDILDVSMIPQEITDSAGSEKGQYSLSELQSEKNFRIDEHEKLLITKALQECEGNQTAASKRLGISRRTIIRKINQYGIKKTN